MEGLLDVDLVLERTDNCNSTVSREERKEEAWRRGSRAAGKSLLRMTIMCDGHLFIHILGFSHQKSLSGRGPGWGRSLAVSV